MPEFLVVELQTDIRQTRQAGKIQSFISPKVYKIRWFCGYLSDQTTGSFELCLNAVPAASERKLQPGPD
jgi:hypothetical protein